MTRERPREYEQVRETYRRGATIVDSGMVVMRLASRRFIVVSGLELSRERKRERGVREIE